MAREDFKTKMVGDKVVSLTEEEIDECVAREEAWAAGAPDRAWQEIRGERNRRLFETDYFALSDVAMSDAMKAYRDNLRKVPQSVSDPVAFRTQWSEHSSGKEGVSDPWPAKPE